TAAPASCPPGSAVTFVPGWWCCSTATPRTRPRAHATVPCHLGRVRPFIDCWAATRGHLREISSSGVDAVLEPLRGHRRYNAITALRSLFRFARRRGLTSPAP